MNHARQCAMRMPNKRTRNTPARMATVVHRIEATGVGSSLLILVWSLAFAWKCSWGVWVVGAVSLDGSSSTRCSLGPSCFVRVIGGSTSHPRSFSLSLLFGVVGNGGSHGFRGLGIEAVLVEVLSSFDESEPSVRGRRSVLSREILRWCCRYRGICTLRIEMMMENTLATSSSVCIIR
jgi:hypothetical protein